jgi:hypothetical protein
VVRTEVGEFEVEEDSELDTDEEAWAGRSDYLRMAYRAHPEFVRDNEDREDVGKFDRAGEEKKIIISQDSSLRVMSTYL